MIILREAQRDDYELMMAWRSNPLIYQGFYQQKEPLCWDEHINWLSSRNKDWRTFMVLYDGRRVGVVTIGQLDHWSPEIGYYIGEISLWGKGVGKQAVNEALEWLKAYGKEYCHTTVLEKNKRSLSLLKSLGFSIFGKARQGEVWLQKKL